MPANKPENYQSAISAMATVFAQHRGVRSNLSEYSPAEVISIIYGVDVHKAQEELKARIQQKITKAQARGIREGKCQTCQGDGWYVDVDKKGEPTQVQCDACQGEGKTPENNPQPEIRPSGEPVYEIEAVSYNGGLPSEESCKMCGKTPCRCMNLAEIIKKMA